MILNKIDVIFDRIPFVLCAMEISLLSFDLDTTNCMKMLTNWIFPYSASQMQH